MRRRDFLSSVGAVASTALLPDAPTAPLALPPGQLLGSSLALGHRLRGGISGTGQNATVPVVIVGAASAAFLPAGSSPAPVFRLSAV